MGWLLSGGVTDEMTEMAATRGHFGGVVPPAVGAIDPRMRVT
jgi:hypothetical protein